MRQWEFRFIGRLSFFHFFHSPLWPFLEERLLKWIWGNSLTACSAKTTVKFTMAIRSLKMADGLWKWSNGRPEQLPQNMAFDPNTPSMRLWRRKKKLKNCGRNNVGRVSVRQMTATLPFVTKCSLFLIFFCKFRQRGQGNFCQSLKINRYMTDNDVSGHNFRHYFPP